MSAPGLLRVEDAPTSPRLRLRQAHAVSSLLPSLGLRVSPIDGGRLAVEMPAPLAEIFLADLEQRASEWKEAMRKARVAEIAHEAELRAASGEGRRQWEETADAWTAEYLRLREAGQGHRTALRNLRGLRADRKAYPQMGDITLAVTEGLARRRNRQRAERDAIICRMAKEGKCRADIADALHVTFTTVTRILQKAGISPVQGKLDAGVRLTALGKR